MNNHNNEWNQFAASALYKRMSDYRAVQNPNILKTLFSTHDEVRLHTPMIGWLLDPSGDHGLGMEPLRRFLEKLGVSVPGNVDSRSVRVWRERYFPGYGRVDLIIEYPGAAIVIENKLHAADQEAQLWRYQQILDKRALGSCLSVHQLSIRVA